MPSPRRNVRRAGGLVKKDALGQTVFSVFLVANHVFDLSGQLAGRGYHTTTSPIASFALKCFTQRILSLSRQAQDQYSPFHQRNLFDPVGHHPMLGGFLFFIVPTIAIESLLLVQCQQLNFFNLVRAQEAQNVHVLDVGRRQAHGAGVVGVIAVAEALGLVV